jgi:hypothetical protein
MPRRPNGVRIDKTQLEHNECAYIRTDIANGSERMSHALIKEM